MEKKICALTMVRNDDFYLRRWVEYYGRELGRENLYIFFDGTDQKIADFYGGFASEEETAAEIKAVYEDCGYVIDTHTAVASAVYKKYVDKTGDKTPTVIASTASPYKFTRSVMQAIGQDRPELSDLELTDVLSDVANTEIPAAIVEIRDAEVRHKTICEVDEMPKVVREFLNI